MENIETLLAALAQTPGFDDDEEVVPAGNKFGGGNSASELEICRDSAASQSIEAPLEVDVGSRNLEVVDHLKSADVPVISTAGSTTGAGEKRKRGRPPRGQLVVKPSPVKRQKLEDEEEDVCFICFDGGSLVLCDRKGCPKAYHPACIKRDEAFFKSKSKWNCGWHICSVCQKGSHYICYTCTYSLCKGCTKDTDFLCVRGNKGFCTTCMKTIMLIEDKDQVQADFDDQGSWEYLFKWYWTCLKEKLSLTLNELIHARKPWKDVPDVACKPQLTTDHHVAHDEKSSMYKSPTQLELNKALEVSSLLQDNQVNATLLSIDNHIEKLFGDKMENDLNHDQCTGKTSMDTNSNEPIIDKDANKLIIDEVDDESSKAQTVDKSDTKKGGHNETDVEDIDRCTDEPGTDTDPKWASKELLEFVGYMKNGDISALSQFDVQTLLLDYVKRNNLRDPRQKGEIICDYRLKNLFGKHRVAHFEMMKLLEYHILMEDTQKNSFIPAGFVGSAANNNEADVYKYNASGSLCSKKRKTRKKSEVKASQNNLSEYAAIDAHNMNLIYLRRDLFANFIEDKVNFQDKIVGSIVRIKIITNDQGQDTYRLVQVVGISKVTEPYKFGDRAADVMLEVLNLKKKEIVSIDAVSNASFTEDECGRLRQSIRYGLGKQFTVGEVQKKAMELQPVRINDIMNAEILRLNHLRDRANEKGNKKELREHVRKLELLNTPEERQRRISEVPVIHADPKMNPNYESEEDIRNHNDLNKDKSVRLGNSTVTGNERNISSCNRKGNEEVLTQAQNKITAKINGSGSHNSMKQSNQVNVAGFVSGATNDQPMLRSNLETSTTTHSIGISSTANNIETEKLWHYRDPNGKIQGPFSRFQLRKWNTTGLFPPDMRIWTNHEQYDSLLLIDALNRKFHGASETLCELPSESHELATGGVSGTASNNKHTDTAVCDVNSSSENPSAVRPDESGSSWSQGWNLHKEFTSSSNDVQVCNLLPPSSVGPTNIALPDLGQDPPINENKSSGLTENLISSAHDTQSQFSNDNRTEENLRSSSIDLRAMSSVAVLAQLSESPDSVRQDGVGDVSNLSSPPPVTCNMQLGVQTVEKQQSVSSDVSVQNSGIFELLSPTPRCNGEDQGCQAETKQSSFINFIVPNSGPCWNHDSGPIVGGLQLPESANEWCGYSPTPAKPSVQVWNSDLVSPSSLKPPEVLNENVANSTSNGNQHSHAFSSVIPNWLSICNETIEFDTLDEESVSDLLAEVDAMESQGGFPSPTSAMKFAKELIQDCKDDCFSSIEFSPLFDPGKRDALSSTGELQLSCQSSVSRKPAGISLIDGLDSFRKSSVHSSASSEGETNFPVYPGEAATETYAQAPNTNQETNSATVVLGTGTETNDPGWGNVQGNINLVTVQGNVNLVLGGPTQGMGNLGWGTNPGPAWPNPNVNIAPITGTLPWDNQRKYGGERFSSPREWSYQNGDPGFGRGRPPWGRQPYGGGSGGGGGGGYSRPPPKGQRVCKFYESGRCKKGAFCDYLHP